MPEPSRALEVGQWATEVPVRASAAIESSVNQTEWASHTSGPSQPTDSMYSTGVQPKCSWQYCSSSSVSHRWVCMRTPLRRDSSAVCRSSSPVTENGEQGATPIRSMEPKDGSW